MDNDTTNSLLQQILLDVRASRGELSNLRDQVTELSQRQHDYENKTELVKDMAERALEKATQATTVTSELATSVVQTFATIQKHISSEDAAISETKSSVRAINDTLFSLKRDFEEKAKADEIRRAVDEARKKDHEDASKQLAIDDKIATDAFRWRVGIGLSIIALVMSMLGTFLYSKTPSYHPPTSQQLPQSGAGK